jgi:biopolymer transport protein ExbD
MHIRKAPSRRRNDRIAVNLASMIDVSFILLFYFLMAAMLENRENRLSAGVQTQSAETTSSVGDMQTQIIEVRQMDGTPIYRIGQNVCRDRTELTAALQPLPKEHGIFVKVFDSVDVGFAVAAVQTAHDAGFLQVTYVPAK